jgi:uncharacterized protein
MEQQISQIATELNLKVHHVRNTIELLNNENTIPFLARYRKEMTGGMDEETLRLVQKRYQYLDQLEQRRQVILNSIEEQDKLTPELRKRIEVATLIQEIEDLYLPYRPKRKTRASIARDKGLGPLAESILAGKIESPDGASELQSYIAPSSELDSTESVLAGALDIIAEEIADDADIRATIRPQVQKFGILNVRLKASDADTSEYKMYRDYSEPVAKIPPHRILAINRGEKQKALTVKIEMDMNRLRTGIDGKYARTGHRTCDKWITEAGNDAVSRLILPALCREVRNALTEKAEAHAIGVFATNLRNLLLQQPLTGKRILGIDPGFRSGCKIAAIDETGKYLQGTTIYPHPPQNDWLAAKGEILETIKAHQIDTIAIGNGTASRETEKLVAEVIDILPDVNYTIVNEAGASVYSASKNAAAEFPDLEASMRGNISIARRLLDPLAELVKIEPKHVGVGLYQHDINQRQLDEALNDVVASTVNSVGVDINTASVELLRHISGLNAATAKNIVAYREQQKVIKDRSELREVKGIGDHAFLQAAGFLRIRDGANFLDNTAIHPESYAIATQVLTRTGTDASTDTISRDALLQLSTLDIEATAAELKVGVPTLKDIVANLQKPGRDIRTDMPPPFLKKDILTLDDVKPGMMLTGTIRNVVDFGAFVDIGLKNDGLVHISELADQYVKDPHQVVAIGQIVQVRIINVDHKRSRVGLSMKTTEAKNL